MTDFCVTPTVPVPPTSLTATVDIESLILCDEQLNGDLISFIRTTVFDTTTGVIISTTDTKDGLPYVVVGDVVSCAGSEFDYEDTLWCVGGVQLVRRSATTASASVITWLDASGAVVVPSPADVASATPGKCEPIGFITQRYRLDWSAVGAASPEVTANTAGIPATTLIVGDRVTITPGWTSYTWVWMPETFPAPDPLNPLQLLTPEVIEDGRSYTWLPADQVIIPQVQTVVEATDDGKPSVHTVELIANNGAYIEVRVIRPVLP